MDQPLHSNSIFYYLLTEKQHSGNKLNYPWPQRTMLELPCRAYKDLLNANIVVIVTGNISQTLSVFYVCF